MKRIVILISGRGSNMEAIVQRCAQEGWPARVVAVVANRPQAAGLSFAAAQGIATAVVDHRAYGERARFDEALAEVIDGFAPDLVVLAGFMRVLTDGFVRRYEGRLLNIHPSLLPAFPGLAAWKQALAYGVKVAGCTVHFVDEGIDSGPVIVQRSVPVRDDDTPDSLHARIQTEEHQAYPEALRLLAAGRLRIDGRRVICA